MYTRGGDRGETGLYGSKRVRKDSDRVEAYGTVDELNSFVGLAVAAGSDAEFAADLKWVQGKLFVVVAGLASEVSSKTGNRVPRVAKEDTVRLEKMIDALQPKLKRLTNFILPGGSVLSAHLHVARSVCRRAERAVVFLSKTEEVDPEVIPFLNRLSTYLFNLARYANALEGRPDEVWKSD